MVIKQSGDFTVASSIRGGKGSAKVFNVALPVPEGPLAMASRIELEPGASIGLHRHDADEEVYAIVSGRGTYSSERGSVCAREGDIFVTKKGSSHGLQNDGDGPLVFFAVVAR